MKKIKSLISAWYYWMGLVSLLLSVVVFLLYALGLLDSDLPASSIAEHWNKSAAELRQLEGRFFEAGWFFDVGDGFLASTAVLALFAATGIPAIGMLFVIFLRRGKRLYAALCLGLLIVLLLAASGFVNVSSVATSS